MFDQSLTKMFQENVQWMMYKSYFCDNILRTLLRPDNFDERSINITGRTLIK